MAWILILKIVSPVKLYIIWFCSYLQVEMIRQRMGGRSIIAEKFIQNISGHSSLENIKSSLWKSRQLKHDKIDVHCLLGDQGILKY